MVSSNPLKVSRCHCPFFDPGLLSAPDVMEEWRYLYSDGFRRRRFSYAHCSRWNSYAGIALRRAGLCRSRRGLVRLVLHRPGVGVTDGIGYASIVLGRLQEGLRRHAII